jgi:hypothetical protein
MKPWYQSRTLWLNVIVALFEIGRAHVRTPVTTVSRMPSSA